MATRKLTALVSTIGFCLGAIACGSSSEDAPAAGGTAGSTAGSPAGGSTSGGSSNGGGGSSAGGATGGGGSSAGGAANCTALSPTGTAPDLIISEVAPGMGIEVFNPGTVAVPVTDNIWFCSQFDYQEATATGGKTMVPPGGYVVLNWPASYTLATAAGGEILLYLGTDFAPTETTQQDYVCWGDHAGGRKDEPIGGGTLFPGNCAPAMTAGAIHRKPSTPGGDAASFDSTAAPSLADCPM